jgi:spermidine/putrescine transport system ATP-binding protein
MSDRIVVMRDGKIEQDGTPRNLRRAEKPVRRQLYRRDQHFAPRSLNALTSSACAPASKAANAISTSTSPLKASGSVLLRPEDLRVDEIHHGSDADGLIGYPRAQL